MNKYLLKYYFVLLVLFASTGMLWADSIYKAVSDTFSISINDYLFVKTIDTTVNVDSLVNIDNQNNGFQLKVLWDHPIVTKQPDSSKHSDLDTENVEISPTDTDNSLSISSDTPLINNSKQTVIDPAKEIYSEEKYSNEESKSSLFEQILNAQVPQILSEWAFPIIIMLFAFGFPFLYQGITNIEEKYHSEEISRYITKSKIYKFYIVTLSVALLSSVFFCSGLLVPIVSNGIVKSFSFGYRAIGMIMVYLFAILFIISTILLVRYLFLYNDANRLFEEWKERWNKVNEDTNISKVFFSLYDYSLRQEKKDLLNLIEKRLLTLVENYRKEKAPKNNKRYALDYPESLMSSLYSLYENTLKTSNPQYQNRVARLYCEVILDRAITSDNLPKIILSEAVLKHFWEMSKITTLYKAEAAFTILWTYLADYYCLLVHHSNTIKEQEKILDLCYVIGALNYVKKAGPNLDFALSYTDGYYNNEKMSFTFIEDVLYRYYHCTNDYMFAKITGSEACEKYKIYDYEKATKKQQIAPLTQYVVFLIIRIYKQGAFLMQFNPINLRKRLFDKEQLSFKRLTSNLIDALHNKSLSSLDKSVFSIKKMMPKEDIDLFARNLMTSSEHNENIRLFETPISEHIKQQFEDRLKMELHVACFELQKLLRIVKRQVQYGFSTSGNTTLSYTNDSSLSIDNSVLTEQGDQVTVPIWNDPITLTRQKSIFVYARILQSSENIFETAKSISDNIYKKHVNKIASILLSMKKGNATWVTNHEDLKKMLSIIIPQKDLIIYVSSKEESNIYEQIEPLKRDRAYNYDHGQSTYNNIPIIIIDGNELEPELYSKISSTFTALRKDELPEISPNKPINDLLSYRLEYENYKDIDAAKLKISTFLEAKLTYHKNICKFIRYKR